jgi:hypothetical protein
MTCQLVPAVGFDGRDSIPSRGILNFSVQRNGYNERGYISRLSVLYPVDIQPH